MSVVAVLLAGLYANTIGFISAALVLPVVERKGWGYMTPRVVRGVRNHSHAGTDGIGLFRRAWRRHLLYGSVLGALLYTLFLALFSRSTETQVPDTAAVDLLLVSLACAGIVAIGYGYVTGVRNREVLAPAAAGAVVHLAVVAALTRIGVLLYVDIQALYPGLGFRPFSAFVIGSMLLSVVMAVRAKGAHRR